MIDEVLEFINRRFNIDCNWKDGNCYYFTVILKDRFPEGKIFYNVIDGHFIFWHYGKFYDWKGIVNCPCSWFVEWDKFDKYDYLEKERIIRYCIL